MDIHRGRYVMIMYIHTAGLQLRYYDIHHTILLLSLGLSGSSGVVAAAAAGVCQLSGTSLQPMCKTSIANDDSQLLS
jgi:hypothetical protein